MSRLATLYRSITLALLVLIAISVYGAEAVNNHLIIFIIDPHRAEFVLKNDAVTMANTVQTAGSGTMLKATTTDGDEIFTHAIESGKTNPLQVRGAQNRSIAQLRAFFVDLFENPPEDNETDIASALTRAIDFANAAPPFRRVTLVLFSGGLHHVGAADFRGAFPSYPWIVHPLSDFSAVPENQTAAKFDAIMIPDRGEFVSAYHRRKILKWYATLFFFRRIQLIGFTDSHNTAALRLTRGGVPIHKVPENLNLNGDLILNAVGTLSTDEEPDAPETDTPKGDAQ